MELVYLWVEDYKNIQKQGFNFSPRFSCNYDEQTNELIIDENDDYIENFFGENINVTAIVGKNGSGKSSVLDILSTSSNCFVVYIEQNEVYICNYIESLVKFSKVFFNKKEIQNYILSNIDDIRMAGFGVTKQEIEEYEKYQKTLCGTTSKIAINSHNKEDKSFLLEYIKRPLFDNNIFNIDFIGFEWKFSLGNDAKYILKVLKSANIRNRYTTDTDDFISKNKVIDTFVLIYFLESVKIKELKYKSVQNEEEFQLYKKNLLKNKIEESDKKTCKYIILFLKYIQSIEDEREIKDLVSDIHITEPNEIRSIRITVSFNKQFLNAKNIELVLNILGQDSFLLEFKDLKKDIKYDYLSSGEQELLFVLFKIHNLLREFEGKQLYLLLDEPTNSFHPQWQKEFISRFIDNIKNYTGIKFHIIFTTHSPFQLSDIPKQNIIFLDKDENGNCKVVNGLKEKKQTFGANIHTLLSDSFFMEDGLMGEFAKSKIDKAIKLLNQDKLSEEDLKYCEQIISIIGEPIVKNQLQRMLDSKKINYIAKDVKEEIEFLKHRIDLLSKRL